MERPFRSITVGEIGSSPARVNRKTTDLYLNRNTWNEIEPAHRVFILLHEKAHCELDTSDEEAVDKLAFKWYVEMGYPLTESVKALTRVLGDSTNHVRRTQLQLDRAKAVDGIAIDTDFKHDNMCASNTLFQELGEFHGFLGETVSYDGCQPNEKPKDCRKRIKVEGRETSRINKSEAKRLKAESHTILAEQGIKPPASSWGSQLGKAFKGLGKGVGSALSKGREDQGAPAPEAPKPNKTGLYIGLGVGGLVIVGLILFMVFKKK